MMRIAEKHAWLRHMDFFLIDLVALYGSYITAFLLKFGNAGFVTDASWRIFSVTALLVDVILTLVISPYSGIFRRRYYEDVVRFIGFVLVNVVCVSVILYLFKLGAVYSRVVVILTYSFYYILALILKYIWKSLVRTGTVSTSFAASVRLLILTEPSRVQSTLENIVSSDTEVYVPVAVCLTGAGPFPEEIAGVPVAGGMENFAHYAVDHDIPSVFVDVRPGLVEKETYRYLAGSGISVHLAIEPMIGFETEQQAVDTVGIVKTVRLEEFSFSLRQSVYRVVKRLLDILFGGIGCLFLLPAMGLIKLAYLMDHDHAPILYSHMRVGQNGRSFKLYKFRSMCPDADEMLRQMLTEEHYRREWELNQKFENDPRITKVGRFIRKTSIDELPQLINVLKGDMSLIGPRPLIEGELEQHGGLKLYQKVKPGITGWWACNGRSNINYRERLELEYYYVKHYSLYLDLMCLFRTVLAVVSREGAQ